MVELIQNSGKVLVADANLRNEHIERIKEMSNNRTIWRVKNEYQPFTQRKVKFANPKQKKIAHFVSYCLKLLKQGKKIAAYIAKLRGKEDCGCERRKDYLNNL